MPSRAAVVVAGLVASFLVAEAVAAQVRALHNLSRQPAQILSSFFSHRIASFTKLSNLIFFFSGELWIWTLSARGLFVAFW
jgi:hypothetical protein